MDKKEKLETATFAAGCFWGVEELFRTTEGVKETTVGYTGGETKNPTYEQVCSGTTGHAEAVQLKFDPEEISYGELLDLFFSCHNPTTKDRQGLDFGSNYRSAIFYHSEKQKKAAEEKIQSLEKEKKFGNQIVTEVAPVKEFYKAEDYHQKYIMKTGKKVC